MHCPPIARRISHARLDYADIRQTSEMLETFAECFLSTLDLHDLPCLISRTFDHFCSAHSAAIVLCLLCRISILQRVCSVSIVCSATHLPWTPEKKSESIQKSSIGNSYHLQNTNPRHGGDVQPQAFPSSICSSAFDPRKKSESFQKSSIVFRITSKTQTKGHRGDRLSRAFPSSICSSNGGTEENASPFLKKGDDRRETKAKSANASGAPRASRALSQRDKKRSQRARAATKRNALLQRKLPCRNRRGDGRVAIDSSERAARG